MSNVWATVPNVQLSHNMFVNCIDNRQNQLFSEMSLRDVMELPQCIRSMTIIMSMSGKVWVPNFGEEQSCAIPEDGCLEYILLEHHNDNGKSIVACPRSQAQQLQQPRKRLLMIIISQAFAAITHSALVLTRYIQLIFNAPLNYSISQTTP